MNLNYFDIMRYTLCTPYGMKSFLKVYVTLLIVDTLKNYFILLIILLNE